MPGERRPGTFLAALLAALAFLVSCSDSPDGGSVRFGNIDRERLLDADSEPENWLTEGRDFGKSHFSTLDQIDPATVGELGFAWEYQTGTSRGLEATPIVVDGVLYTSGTTGRAYAIDAATGEQIWAFDPQSDGGAPEVDGLRSRARSALCRHRQRGPLQLAREEPLGRRQSLSLLDSRHRS